MSGPTGWAPVWDAARATWVEPSAGLMFDARTGQWVTLGQPPGAARVPPPSPSLAYRAGRSTSRSGVSGVVVVGFGLLLLLAGGALLGKAGDWVSDTMETNGAEDMAAGDCFSPSVSEMISASFDRVDCADAEPYWDMKVLWVDHASSLDEAESLGWNCSGIAYTPDDQATLDATDGVVICAETVTGADW